MWLKSGLNLEFSVSLTTTQNGWTIGIYLLMSYRIILVLSTNLPTLSMSWQISGWKTPNASQNTSSASTHWQFTVRGESLLCSTGFMRGFWLVSKTKSVKETESWTHFLSSGKRPKTSTPNTGNVYKNILRNKIRVRQTNRKPSPLLLTTLPTTLPNQLSPTLVTIPSPPARNPQSQKTLWNPSQQNRTWLESWTLEESWPNRNDNTVLIIICVCFVVSPDTKSQTVPQRQALLKAKPLPLPLLLPQLRGKTPLQSQKNNQQFTHSSTEGGLHGDPLCWRDCLFMCSWISNS